MRRASDYASVSLLVAIAIVAALAVIGWLAWADVEQHAPPAAPATFSVIPDAGAAPLARPERDTTTSGAAAALVERIVAARDNEGASFVVVDKVVTTLYVFHPDGRLAAATPVLLGSALGDDTVPGIGDRPIADVRPEERTTPAGRYMGEMGRNMRGEDVVWVDYDAAVSMHRLLTSNAWERRVERLRSPSPDDNRISYGCINVPADFYVARLRPIFLHARTPIYILPEVRSLDDVFRFDVRVRKGSRQGN